MGPTRRIADDPGQTGAHGLAVPLLAQVLFQQFRFGRLDEVAVEPGLLRADAVFIGAVAGNCDKLGARRNGITAQLSSHVPAVESWEPDVTDDDVRVDALCEADAFSAVVG